MPTMAARAAYRGGGKESITIAMSTMAARAAYRGGGKRPWQRTLGRGPKRDPRKRMTRMTIPEEINPTS